jgi:Cu2+-exporting ATPase
MVDVVYCVHCGAVAKHPVTKIINGQSLSFCCGGCLQVYKLLHEEGVDSGQIGTEETINPFPEAAQKPKEAATSQTISFHVSGMSCANCVATVSRQLHLVPGVMDVSVVLETERATVKMIPDKVSIADLKRAVEKAGYEMAPEGDA